MSDLWVGELDAEVIRLRAEIERLRADIAVLSKVLNGIANRGDFASKVLEAAKAEGK